MTPFVPPTLTKQAPEISVVVPVYNAANFLSTAIGSVLKQTFGNWELILVDDGSTDNSLALCRDHAARDSRIHLITQTNSGPSAARNQGVRKARGTFILFLDADDQLSDNALAHLWGTAAREGGDLILGNFQKQENDSPPMMQPVAFAVDAPPFIGETRVLAGLELLDYVRHFLNHPSNHLVSYCWGRLYRRAIIVEHAIVADESMHLFEDFAFNLAFLCQTRRLIFVNQPVYIYVLRSDHTSASMSILNAASLTNDMRTFLAIVERFATALALPERLWRMLRQEAAHTLIHYAIIFIIRTCRQITPNNREHIEKEVALLLEASVIREALPFYRFRPGTSLLIPLLMRLKLVRLLAVVAKTRGIERYGKMKRQS